jgi:hypothetical protein
MAGQSPQIAACGHDFIEAVDLGGFDRGTAETGFGGQQGRDRLLAFLRFQ